MKKTQKTVGNEGGIPPITTQTLASANRFDHNALETNRAGRVSFSQVLNVVQFAGYILLLIVGLIMALVTGAGTNNDGYSTNNFTQSVFSCVIGFATIAFLIWVYIQGGKLGAERYRPRDILELPGKFLIPVDLLRGRVEIFEGTVERSTASTPRSPFGLRRKLHLYVTETDSFCVTGQGYEAFPSEPRNCRVYYLPLSRVIVNLELL